MEPTAIIPDNMYHGRVTHGQGGRTSTIASTADAPLRTISYGRPARYQGRAGRLNQTHDVAALPVRPWLCFKCGGRWGHDHVCPKSVELHVMEEIFELFGTTWNSTRRQHQPTIRLTQTWRYLARLSLSESCPRLSSCLCGFKAMKH